MSAREELEYLHALVAGALSSDDHRNAEHVLRTVSTQIDRMLATARELPGYTDEEILTVWRRECEGKLPPVSVVATVRKLFAGVHVGPRRREPTELQITAAMTEHEMHIKEAFSTLGVRWVAMRKALEAAFRV